MVEGTPRYGILESDRVTLLAGAPFDGFQVTGEVLPLKDLALLPPCEPSKILCIGLNYKDHAEECNIALPVSPVVFMKPSTAVIGQNDTIIYPSLSSRVDYEAELAVVIGKEAHLVPEAEAHRYIYGYTCANDVTARDLQPENGQWIIAKSFDTFLPLGPLITDEIDPGHCDITAKVNGSVVQSSDTGQLIFKPDFLVSYLSQVMTLKAGDVIITGTPAGIGPMEPGDVVEVSISGIGTLRNHIKKCD